MNIAVIADVLGEENNGTTTACMNLVRYLRSRGDTVRIVCCDRDKEETEGYYVVDTYNLGPLINYMVKRNNVALAKADRRILTKAISEADIVHVMMPFSLGKKAVRIAGELGKPVTAGFHVQAENFTAHIGMMNNRLANHLTYHGFYMFMYRNVTGIHYPTQFIRDLFEKEVRHTTRGYVISNGVHERFARRQVCKPAEYQDKYVILFTGRYSKEKSHKVLIRAVDKSRYRDKIQLIFAGQGPRDTEIRDCAKRHGILMPVMKFFPQEELVDIINYTDLYCHPAEVEIEAIACLEAISCGVVPVISDSERCATKAFALDDKNLFRCNDTGSLAEKIDYWLDHPEERAERSEKYLGYARKFSQAECMKAMRNMMEECIQNYVPSTSPSNRRRGTLR